MSLNVLIMSVTMFKDRTSVHGNIDDNLIKPEIKAAEDMYIHPILGTALYNKIINDINVSGTPLGSDYVTLVNNYILDALQYYVLSELPEAISFQFWNKGVVRKSGDNTESPSMADLVDISNKYRKRAEWYAQRLTTYLRRVSTSSVLPEYYNGNTLSDSLTPQTTPFTMPIYLDDYPPCVHLDKDNCGCRNKPYPYYP